MNDFEDTLRVRMTQVDADAPVRPDLADWLLATTPRTGAGNAAGMQRPATRWALPLLAAAAVIAFVVAGSLVWSMRSAHRQVPVPPASSLPSAALPTNFTASGVSFRDATHGVAVGDGACGTARCAALVRTADGGATWHGVPLPRGLGTADGCIHDSPSSDGRPCVSQAAFADDVNGYLWGGGRLYQTVNGGRSWTRPASISGQAGTVVVSGSSAYVIDGRGSGATQQIQVLRSAVGSTSWRPVVQDVPGYVSRSSLVAGGGYVYLLAYDPVPATRPITVIGPDGVVRSGAGGDFCSPGNDRAAFPTSLSVAPDGAVVLACEDNTHSWIRVSTDHAASFGPARTVPGTHHVTGGPAAEPVTICAFSSTLVAAAVAHVGTSGRPGYVFEVSGHGGTSWRKAGETDISGALFAWRATGPITGYRIDPASLGIQTTVNGGLTWRARPIR